ncbi:MAG: T9SS type A sorting domain-containing protein [Bacteroidales bacterium]|nr:T9SS type A sorting domain-containing protein [Bacteroidales bacterium]
MKNLILSIILTVFVCSMFAQENCTNAVKIEFDEYSTCGQIAITNTDLTGAVPSTDLPYPTCGNFDGSTNDLWYYITVPEGVSELAFHVFNAPLIIDIDILIHKPSLAIYSGSPEDLSLLNCFYNEGGPYANGEIRFETVDELTPGENIYLRVWDMDNSAFPFFIAASVRTEIPEHSCESPALLGEGGCNILAPEGTIDAPEQCNWNVSDNTIYYYFVVNPSDPQPVIIDATYIFCFENTGGDVNIEETELQMALYKWNGKDCSWIGGSPNSIPPNDSTYITCQNGTGSISIEENLNPGLYMIALDGYSMISGTSLCTFEFSMNTSNEIICPEDTILCHSSAPLLLDIAQPIGGEYTCTNTPDAIIDNFFDPAVCSGPQDIIYSLGPFTCGFTIYDAMYPSSVPDIEICLVTVTENNKNKVMWEKPITDSLEEFHIYKFDGTDFSFYANVNYNDESTFIDENSEPQNQAYRYKIAGYSTCGYSSELSDFHQTVLLNITEETDLWYLSWIPYIGVDDFTINILRGTTPENLEIIESYGSDVTEYYDNNPPEGFVYYQIEVVLSTPCDVGKSTSKLYSNVATNNPDYYILLGTNNLQNKLNYKLYPNPTSQIFSISLDNFPVKVQIYDTFGRIVKSINNYSGEQIDVSDMCKGIYFVKLVDKNEITVDKLIIE